MTTDKIAREVAEGEFAEWAAKMRVTRKLDPSTLNDEDKKSLAELKATILGAICDGNLVRNDSGDFVLTPPEGEPDMRKPITFRKPTGATLMATDKAKAGEPMAKQFKFLADMTGEPPSHFSKLDLVDLDVCIAISALFLAK